MHSGVRRLHSDAFTWLLVMIKQYVWPYGDWFAAASHAFGKLRYLKQSWCTNKQGSVSSNGSYRGSQEIEPISAAMIRRAFAELLSVGLEHLRHGAISDNDFMIAFELGLTDHEVPFVVDDEHGNFHRRRGNLLRFNSASCMSHALFAQREEVEEQWDSNETAMYDVVVDIFAGVTDRTRAQLVATILTAGATAYETLLVPEVLRCLSEHQQSIFVEECSIEWLTAERLNMLRGTACNVARARLAQCSGRLPTGLVQFVRGGRAEPSSVQPAVRSLRSQRDVMTWADVNLNW